MPNSGAGPSGGSGGGGDVSVPSSAGSSPPAAGTPLPPASPNAGAGTTASGAPATAAAAVSSSGSKASVGIIGRSPRIPPSDKVLVHFRPVGSAPILRQTKFKVTASHSFAVIIAFLRKQLHYKPTDSLVRSFVRAPPHHRPATTRSGSDVSCVDLLVLCWCLVLRAVSVL